MTHVTQKSERIVAGIVNALMVLLRPIIWLRAALLFTFRDNPPFLPGAHLQQWVGRAYRVHFVKGVSVVVEVLGITRSWPVPSLNRALVIEFPSGDLAVLTRHQWKPLLIEEATPAGRRIVSSLRPITVPEEAIRYDLGAEGAPMQPSEALIWHDRRFATADEN